MRTNSKPVIAAVREHLLSYFDEAAQWQNDHREEEHPELPEDRIFTNVDAMISQIDSMLYGGRTSYATALDWVEGGGALIYHQEVKEFLNNLGINPTNQEYTDEKSWRLYCHLLAREMAKLYEERY